MRNIQNTVLKVNIKKFKDNNETIDLNVDTKYFRSLKTLNSESELFRIVKHLRNYYKEHDDIKIEDDLTFVNNVKYDHIQDLIVVHIKDPKDTKYYHSKCQTSDQKFTINYALGEGKDKISINYKRLLASSSHIRNNKIIFVNEKMYNDVVTILLCGMPEYMEVKSFAKFNSYFGLCATDGFVVNGFNFIIVDDYKNMITEQFDVIEEVKINHYNYVGSEEKTIEIMPFDGAGLIDVSAAKQICDQLNVGRDKDDKIDYTPSSFLLRVLPGIKGNVYTYDLVAYAKDKNAKHIIDIWGKVYPAEQIDFSKTIILTKSMMKFWDKYKSYGDWETEFNKIHKGYKRTINICSWSEDIKDLKHKVPLSYQPLQSLFDIDDKKIKSLCQDTIKNIKKITSNVNEFIKFRNINSDDRLPAYYKALKENTELFYDPWIQKKMMQDIEGYKKRALIGGIFFDGNYQVFGIDCVALASYIFFGKYEDFKINSVIPVNQVYSNYWNIQNEKIQKKIDENKAKEKKLIENVLLVRFPHVSHEWKVSKLVKHDENTDIKYMKYQTATICNSIHDSTDMRLGTADHDNDHIVSIRSDLLEEVINDEEDVKNTVLHVKTYSDASDTNKRKINNIEGLVYTDVLAMKNNIGVYVNKITRLWNTELTENIKKYIKTMNIVCCKVIDFAKTGIAAEIPLEIHQELKKNKNLPYFMRYRYPDRVKKQNRENFNSNLVKDKEDVNLFNDNESTMNKICKYLEKEFKGIEGISIKGKFDYTKMYNRGKFDKSKNKYYKDTLNKVIELKEEYDQLVFENSKKDHGNSDEKYEMNEKYKLFFDYCKEELLNICPEKHTLTDILVCIHYDEKKFDDKSILWVFGDILRQRIKGEKLNIETPETIAKDRKDKKKTKYNEAKAKMRNIDLLLEKENNNKLLPKEIININDVRVDVSENEIKYICESNISKKSKHLLLCLLILSKKYGQHNEDVRIHAFSKSNKKLKAIDLIHMADIKNNNYDEYKSAIKELKENNLISLSFPEGHSPDAIKTKAYIVCNVNVPNDSGNTKFTISKLSECKDKLKCIS